MAVRRLGGWAVGLAVLLTAQPPNRLTAQTIDTIIIDNGNVFHGNAEGAPHFVVKIANALHIRTRQWVIRRRLLLDKGDKIDTPRLEETERALRSLGVFRFVRVDTLRLPRGSHGSGGPDDPLAVEVVTADGWSTQPQASYTRSAGDVAWGLGFIERNFLGTATELDLNYDKNPDRSRFDFGFSNPYFIARRARVALHYSHLSDGKAGGWQLGLPFYETSAPYALETYGEAAHQRVLRYANGVLQDSAVNHLFRIGVSGGVATHSTTRDYIRLIGGAEWRRENFDSLYNGTVAYSTFTNASAGLLMGRVRFRVLEQFNSYARREDVDLSPALYVGAVVQSHVGYETGGQMSAIWKGGFALFRGQASGVDDSTRIRGGVTVVSQNLRRHTLIGHFEIGSLYRPKPGAEFNLWLEQRGPRLYGVHDFTGTRMVWLVVEDRILVAQEVAGLMGLGIAPFLDYGGAWFGTDRRLRGDVGLSLRFGPTRAVRGQAGELAFGYRFGEGLAGKRWALTLRKGIAF